MTKFFAFALALLLFAACSQVPVLRIGVIAYDYEKAPNIEGYSTDMATRLAAQDWNAGGKIKIELKLVIVSVAPEDSVDAVRRLATDSNVSAIVGPSSSIQAIPAGGAAEAAKIPLIASVSSNPATTANRSWVFRMCYLDPDQARGQVYYALDVLKPKSASLIYDESDPSSAQQAQIIQEEWKHSGFALRRVMTYSSDDPSFGEKVRKSGPWTSDEVVFLPNASGVSLRVAAQLRSFGYQGVFVGGDGWDREEMRKSPFFDGSVMTTNYWSGQTTAGNLEFARNYEAFAGRPPGDTAALTYDAVGLLASTVLRVGSVESNSLRKGLADGTVYQGISGPISHIHSGDPARAVVLLKFQSGQVTFGGTQ